MWNEEDGRDCEEIYNNIISKNFTLAEIDRWSAKEQFKMDIAMWYGQINSPSDQENKRWKVKTIGKVFSLLFHGGLMVRRAAGGEDSNWTPWGNRGPLASVISHTARVLVKLPTDHQAFWQWLWGEDVAVQKRFAATHGVTIKEAQLLLPDGNGLKGASENKEGDTCDHFGINLALGGEGNNNPVSGNKIYPDGTHGHLYFALSNDLFHGHKYLLIATEQSAPIDRFNNKQGGRFNFIQAAVTSIFGRGVPDQYEGFHGIGGHNQRACNGGQDWTNKYLSRGEADRLANYGPGPHESCYLDGIFVDISKLEVFSAIRDNPFDLSTLGLNPRPKIAM